MEYGDSRLTKETIQLFDLGDCVFDYLKGQENIKYPLMYWGVIRINTKDPELFFMVPLLECDPYGRITDPEFEYPPIKNWLKESVFAEDTVGQDHRRAYVGNGEWVHATDLIGLDQDRPRPHIVKPCQQYFYEMLAGQ